MKKIIVLALCGMAIIIGVTLRLAGSRDAQYQKFVDQKINEIKTRNPAMFDRLNAQLQDAQGRINKDPQDFAAWQDKGVALQALGDWKAAEQVYLSAIKISARTRVVWNNLGAIYTEQKNFDRALWAYNNLLENFPDQVDAYLKEFEILAYALKDDQRAKTFLDFAIRVFENANGKTAVALRQTKAEYLAKLGEVDIAIKEYQTLAIMDGGNKEQYESAIKKITPTP